MTRAAAYIRVSTDDQARTGISVEAQEQMARAYCERQGYRVVGVFKDEGISASIPFASRPEGAALHATVLAGKVQHLVVYKLDRLFRDTIDGLSTTRAWAEVGLAVHQVDHGPLDIRSPQGRLHLTVLLAFGEYERACTSERTTMANAQRRARGERMGPIPLENPELLARVREMRADGLPWRPICRALAQEGFRPARADEFHPETLRRLLQRSGG